MHVTFTNDWKYLFSPWAIGGRFSNFTLIHIAYFRTGLNIVDGWSLTVLGLGVRVRFGKAAPHPTHENTN